MFNPQPRRRAKGPRTWAEAYRELADIQARADEIFARGLARLEEEIASSPCCIAIAETLRAYRTRAWRCAVREHERGVLSDSDKRQKQLELFRG